MEKFRGKWSVRFHLFQTQIMEIGAFRGPSRGTAEVRGGGGSLAQPRPGARTGGVAGQGGGGGGGGERKTLAVAGRALERVSP